VVSGVVVVVGTWLDSVVVVVVATELLGVSAVCAVGVQAANDQATSAVAARGRIRVVLTR
jgi:hypothetical protein